MTTDQKSVTDDLFQMLDDAEVTQESGEMVLGAHVNEPTDADSFPMAVGELKSAGYVIVYDIRDGRSFPYNKNMLPGQLRKTDPRTGNRIFTTRDPGYRPKYGGYVCWLNPEHPKYSDIEAMGLPKCEKTGIPSEYESARHMQLKHGRQHDAINEAEQRKREDERDRLNRELLEKAIGVNGSESEPSVELGGESYAATEDAVQASYSASTHKIATPDGIRETKVCPEPDCDDVLESKPGGMHMKMKWHHKKKHGAE